jgi:pantoate--beta-alanine ligase
MYPFGVELAAKVHVPGVSAVLEGAFRPGHFDGVCTVVSRLFNQVLPDVAVFGTKDYQQLAVIRQMVADLQFPIDIVGGEIVREANGLAMSSRNQYLSDAERATAAVIHRTLRAMRGAVDAGTLRAQVEADAEAALREAGFVPDYAVVRRPDFSVPVDGEGGPQVALIAARLGRTRLIDNIEFEVREFDSPGRERRES